ncbi:MAG TPA: TetR/AcrR family transcriptional regulator [Ignavibacteriales bacterium]|nr:TetR/AcrR family transcriptional regulator [Ignavibacteriales bacterium]
MPRTKEQFELLRKESRQKIQDAALEVFARQGYHSSTVSSIAKAAGVSQGLLYNYFKSKEDVLRQLMTGMISDVMAKYLPFKPGDKITRKDFINVINFSVDVVLEKPSYWKLYFSIFVQPEVMSIVMDEVMKMSEPYLKTFTRYFADKGDKDPVTMLRYFSAVMDGIQLHCMIDPETFPADKIKKLLIKQFA